MREKIVKFVFWYNDKTFIKAKKEECYDRK